MEAVGPASDVASLRLRLRDLLVERAIRYGHFVLASGQTSSYYVDKTQITLMGEGLYCLGRIILDQIEGMEVQAVGGMTIGADPIAGAVSALGIAHGQHIDAFIVRKERKERGTQQRVEGPLPQGARVVVLEDVITTGGSAIDAIKAVEEERDAEVVQVLSMVDRLQGGREAIVEAGYDFTALFTVEDLGVKVE
ncbi:MAG: orotate phosphoribosyltransferase [candidate division WS1 bacterium]|jgi:orotate phosphoribosyltransferase|nr:orotate phosphoribosyltransferase [candidate division WS1 bacterium]